ncbi:MAG TPA: hypothetical protein VG454_10535 [Gemmatimonadales bacterium]|nr:hypothetical protein [Gemmatimonadales bacterium]
MAVLGGLALAAACSSDSSSGPPPGACGAHGTDLTLAVGAYQSIDPATDSGCVNFPKNASATDSAEYLVLPWSAAGTPNQSAPFSLASATQGVTMSPPQLAQLASFARSSHGVAAVSFDRFLRTMARSRSYPLTGFAPQASASTAPPASTTAGPPAVGSTRTFKVCANFTCSPPFATVGAKALSVGQHIAIYVDTTAPSPGLSTTDLDSLKNVFDSRLYPLDIAAFGQPSDIDSNTVTIVLMTGVVNKLVSKSRCHTDGYIAGFFFSGDVDPDVSGQYNNGEIFYSIVADRDSTLSCAHPPAEVLSTTPVTFTHEFQHMINFVQHVRVKGGNPDEGWLDEGISKYAEEIAGRSYLVQGDTASFSRYAIGAVYDAGQYLLDPGSSPLLIPVDTGTLAEVGASWLFVRYIVDQFGNVQGSDGRGDALTNKLVQTGLTGSANVATQTAQPFDQTVSRWALANFVDSIPWVPTFTAPAELKYKVWHFHRTFASLNSQDPADFPHPYPLIPQLSAGSAVNVTGTLRSGSGDYVRAVQAPNGAAFTLRFGGSGNAQVSAAVVPRLIVLRIR